MKLGCVVMAAGDARRFGENKLAAALEGKTLIARALDAVPQGVFCRTVVVTQYPEVAALARSRGFLPLENRHPDWGISHTISIGVNALADCDGILFLVSDQPLLKRQSVERVATRWRENPDRIVAAAHNGTRGNPCMFPKSRFGELLALQEDHGGNTVIRAHMEQLLLVEVPQAELTDVDTPAALAALKQDL